ncbi:MAG: ABC transporter family substrate-binding protein [Streptosporangiaceae bacterium]
MNRLMVICLLAAGCAAPDTVSTTGPVKAAEINPQPRSELRGGGTLRWPLFEFPAQWNYAQVNGTRGSVDYVTRALMPYVMSTDAEGRTRPDPDYVLSAGIVDTQPAQVVRYVLNPKAHWSDGKQITYRDFAAQAKALSGKAKGFRIGSSSGYRQIGAVHQGRNDHEVLVSFATPFADWPSLFAPLYPAATNSDPDLFNDGWQGRFLQTAGPFRPGKIDPTTKTITIVRNRGWWGRPAKLDSIVFRIMDTSAMPGAFANGEVDLLDIGGDANAYARAKSVPGTVIRRAGGPDWTQITLNGAGPVLGDIRVRRAVALGVNRRSIVDSALQDLDWPVRTLGNHFLMNSQVGYRDNSGDLGGYDPGRARRLLDEAGWRMSGDRRVRDGKPLMLRFVIPSSVASARNQAELVQAMLGEIGVGVDIRPVAATDFFDKYVTPGDFDIVPFSWLGTPFPASSMRSIFVRPSGGDIQQNFARVGTAAIDRALDRAGRELDPGKARALIQEADRLIWQQVTVLPLFQRPQLIAVRRNLANFGARGFQDLSYEDIGYTG